MECFLLLSRKSYLDFLLLPHLFTQYTVFTLGPSDYSLSGGSDLTHRYHTDLCGSWVRNCHFFIYFYFARLYIYYCPYAC